MSEKEIAEVAEVLKNKLKKLNKPYDDMDEIVKNASKHHSQNSSTLQAWATRIFFQKHPDIAKDIHTKWHFT